MSHLLRDLTPDGADEHEAGDQCAHDRSHGVGGIHASDEASRILPAQRHGAQCERKAGTPQDRRRQRDPDGAHQVELEHEHLDWSRARD